jgi:DNA helicase IV
VNYRTPADVMDLAARVLRHAAPGLRPPRSVRRTGTRPEIVRIAEPVSDIIRIAQRVRTETEGTVAVIACAGDAAGIAGPLGVCTDDLEAAITVLTPIGAKGLEFDAVIVVDPLAIEQAHSLRTLYVALTRTTNRLVVCHRDELPAWFSTPADANQPNTI